MQQYGSLFSIYGLSEIPISLLNTLNIILALSCRLDTTTSADRRCQTAEVFFGTLGSHQICIDIMFHQGVALKNFKKYPHVQVELHDSKYNGNPAAEVLLVETTRLA